MRAPPVMIMISAARAKSTIRASEFAIWPSPATFPAPRTRAFPAFVRLNRSTKQPNSNHELSLATPNPTPMTSMQELLAKSMRDYKEGTIVKGRILEVRPAKSSWTSATRAKASSPPTNSTTSKTVKVGDEIDVLIEKLENEEGMVVLSKEKADLKQNWDKIVTSLQRRRPHHRQGQGHRQRRPARQHRRRGLPARLADRHHPAQEPQRSTSATPTISRSSRSTRSARTSSSPAAN